MLRKYKSLYSSTTNTFSTGEAVTITPASVVGLPTDTEITLTFDRVDGSGTKTPDKMERIRGTITGGNFVISSGGRAVEGTEQVHTSPVVEMIWNADDWNDTVDHILTEHNQDGTHLTTTPVFYNSLKTNCLINAGFTVNQRGYVSNATLAAGVYGHDRWKAGAGGGDYTFTQLAQATTITIKTGKSLIQVIEDKNVIGGTYTLSWTGTAQARFGIDSATPSGAYAASPITITTQTAGTVMSVEFNAGTLSNVVLNSGTVALPFMPKSYEEELRACQRYCQVFGTSSAYYMYGNGVAGSTTVAYIAIHFPVKMRTAPKLTSSTTASDFRLNDGASTVNLSAVPNNTFDSVIQSNDLNFVACTVDSGLTQYRPYRLMNNGANAYLIFSAEL